jgi:uncharacterized protein YggE
MKLFRAALACTALAVSAPVLAQVASPAPVLQPGNAVLTITAEGRSARTPDLAIFSAGVTTQGKTAADALAENARRMTAVMAALRNAGIAERDIQTSNLSINPVYSDPARDAILAVQSAPGRPVPPPEQVAPRIIGYSVSNNVSVRQRKLGEYGRVIDTLVSAGANQVNGPSFEMDEPDPALDEARIEAMKKARTRAELYARAAGMRVVRILSISESGGYYRPPQVMFARAEVAAPPAPPVAPGEVQLTASVTVLFELAP